jgi:hypothetical protein
MGLALLNDGANRPDFPHVVCSDGYAWMDEEARRACYSTSLAVSAIIVAQAIDPPPDLPSIDRAIAVAQMTERQLRKLFLPDCGACGADHYQIALRLVRIVREFVHPEAIIHLREARVPECLLRRPHYLDDDHGPPPNASPKELRSYEETSRLIPIWRKDPARTLAAQIAWSMQYQLNPPRRRGAIPKAMRRPPVTNKESTS